MSIGQSIILIACGSFNPVTVMHLRMFELARDYLHSYDPSVKVKKGYLSPVSDLYGKKGLVSCGHRIEMLKRAAATNEWLDVLPWECEQSKWTPTAQVLDEYYKLLDCAQNNIRLLLLCGADVLESFSVKGLWKEADIISIIKNHGLVVISRPNHNAQQYVTSSKLLTSLKDHIYVVHEWNENDLSSTKIRLAVQKGNSIKYLVPDSVVEYIQEHRLYSEAPQSDHSTLAPFLGTDK